MDTSTQAPMGTFTQPSESGGTPTLIHTYEHRAYPLPVGRAFTIGRDSECDIRVNEVAVSRRHAAVEPTPDGGSFTLLAVGATPMLVNGMPLEGPHTLQNGDSFTVGTMRFTYTTERLPTGMAIGGTGPRERVVEDRRRTVTFPTQPGLPEIPRKRGGGTWWVAALVIAAVVAIGAAMVLLRSR